MSFIFLLRNTSTPLVTSNPHRRPPGYVPSRREPVGRVRDDCRFGNLELAPPRESHRLGNLELAPSAQPRATVGSAPRTRSHDLRAASPRARATTAACTRAGA